MGPIERLVNSIKDKLKTFDYEADSLWIRFDLATQQFQMTKLGRQVIPHKQLTEKSIEKLNEYNKRLEDKEILAREIKKAQVLKIQGENKEKRRKELSDMGISMNSFTVFSRERGSFSKKVFDQLYPILTEENTIVGIHRVGWANMEDINNIFDKGFYMSGHGFNTVQAGGVPIYENFRAQKEYFGLFC